MPDRRSFLKVLGLSTAVLAVKPTEAKETVKEAKRLFLPKVSKNTLNSATTGLPSQCVSYTSRIDSYIDIYDPDFGEQLERIWKNSKSL